MNWEQEVYVDYNRVKLNIEKGYQYLVDKEAPVSDDVDSDKAEFLYELLFELDIDSYYHVGFGFGEDLINISRLMPHINVGGMTWFDHSVSFGQKLFGLKDYGFDLTVGEYPYKPIKGEWDLVNLGRLPEKSALGREIVAQAISEGHRYILFFADNSVRSYDGYTVELFGNSGLDRTPVLLTKIRGTTANHLIVDEMADIDKDTFEEVVDGFTVIGKPSNTEIINDIFDVQELPKGADIEYPLDFFEEDEDDDINW